MNLPLVSIITVTFNAQSVIESTLQSVADQTYPNIEIVMIDGASTDDTVKIVEKFSAYIGTLISEKDRGIYDAMNKGIQQAKGEWLFFLNAGDYFYNNTVIEDILQKKNIAEKVLIYGKIKAANHASGVDFIRGNAVSIQDCYKGISILHQAAFIKKEMFNYIGYYDARMRIAADAKWFSLFFIKGLGQQAMFVDNIICLVDMKGASSTNKTKAYHELLQYSIQLFPWYITLKLIAQYPYIRLRLWLTRILSEVAWFKKWHKKRIKKRFLDC